MLQVKVGQTHSCCQTAQTPARARGYTALCQPAPTLKDVFTCKETLKTCLDAFLRDLHQITVLLWQRSWTQPLEILSNP